MGQRVVDLLPFAMVSAAAMLLNSYIMKHAGVLGPSLLGFGPGLFYTALRAVFSYAAILLFPFPQSVWHPFPYSLSLADTAVILSLSGLLAALVIAYLSRKKYPLLSFSVFWYLLFLAPALGFAYTRMLLFERYLFLPSVGFAMALGVGMNRVASSRGNVPRRVGIMVIVLIIFVLSLSSAFRNGAWKGDLQLLEVSSRHYPRNVEFRTSLGKHYYLQGRYDEAFKHFKAAKLLTPVSPDYDFYRALYLYERGDLDAAMGLLEPMSRNYDMGVVDVYHLMGLIYEKEGRMRDAARSYERAIRSGLSVTAPAFGRKDSEEALKRLRMMGVR